MVSWYLKECDSAESAEVDMDGKVGLHLSGECT